MDVSVSDYSMSRETIPSVYSSFESDYSSNKNIPQPIPVRTGGGIRRALKRLKYYFHDEQKK